MRVFRNLVHLVSGGLVLSTGWLLSAVLCSVLPVTRPLARASLQVAILCLWPSGKEAVRESDIERLQLYVRTGAPGRCALADAPPEPARAIQIALWLPLGVVLAACHILHAVIQAIPRLSNPWESRSVSLLPIAVYPLGWRVVPRSGARAAICPAVAQLTSPEDSPLLSPLVAASAARLAGPAAKLAGVAIVLWASGSGDVIFSPPAMADRVYSPAYEAPFENWVRPAVAPVFPVARPVPVAPVPVGCAAAPPAAPSTLRLSRRPAEYALPLGSRPVPASIRAGQIVPIARIEKLHLFATSKRDDKLRGPVCREDIAASVGRSGAYAAKVALARFRASKIGPDAAIWRADTGVSALGQRLAGPSDLRAVVNTGKLLASIGEAKSRATMPAESAESRIERTALLGVPGRDQGAGPGDA